MTTPSVRSPTRPGTPYYNANGACQVADHSCVDGLSCTVDGVDNYVCSNSKLDQDGGTVSAFHGTRRCVIPDLDHAWSMLTSSKPT